MPFVVELGQRAVGAVVDRPFGFDEAIGAELGKVDDAGGIAGRRRAKAGRIALAVGLDLGGEARGSGGGVEEELRGVGADDARGDEAGGGEGVVAAEAQRAEVVEGFAGAKVDTEPPSLAVGKVGGDEKLELAAQDERGAGRVFRGFAGGDEEGAAFVVGGAALDLGLAGGLGDAQGGDVEGGGGTGGGRGRRRIEPGLGVPGGGERGLDDAGGGAGAIDEAGGFALGEGLFAVIGGDAVGGAGGQGGEGGGGFGGEGLGPEGGEARFADLAGLGGGGDGLDVGQGEERREKTAARGGGDGDKFFPGKGGDGGRQIGGGEARAGDLEGGLAAAVGGGGAEEDDPSFVVGRRAKGRGGRGRRGESGEGAEDAVAAQRLARGGGVEEDRGGVEAAAEERGLDGLGGFEEAGGLGVVGGEADEDQGARGGVERGAGGKDNAEQEKQSAAKATHGREERDGVDRRDTWVNARKGRVDRGARKMLRDLSGNCHRVALFC